MPVSYSDILVSRLAKARRVAVLTGAGVSAESGIATFRDPGGIWARFKPEELANVEAFLGNPDLVQSWYAERRRIAAEARPNPGHEALAKLESLITEFTLVTQNVDGLHARAGSENIIELHGNITRSYCIDCKLPFTEMDASAGKESAEEDQKRPLTCTSCNGLIRPDVVWFGEMLPEHAIEKAFQAARRANVVLSIGTSAVVYPAADVPLVARDNGAYVAEINIETSAIGHLLNETVLGSSGTVLPALVESVMAEKRMIAE